MRFTQELYKIVAELRLIAAAGLEFATTPYEIERYTRLRQACAQLIALIEDTDPPLVLTKLDGDLFEHRVSPMLTADAVVLRHDRVLLIKRHDSRMWALPGGIVEVNQTLAEAALLELAEETGLAGRIIRLLGIFDSHRWESQEKEHLHHAVFLVVAQEGEPHRTREAVEVGFFEEDALPPLAAGHHRRIPFILRQLRGEEPVPYLDLPAETG